MHSHLVFLHSMLEEPKFSTFSSWILRFKWWILGHWNEFRWWILALVIVIITLITLVKRISTKLDKELTHND